MTEKLFHKGWLYERDGVRFTPFVLKESIVDRKGQTGWADEVDVKLIELEDTLIGIDGINSGEVSELKNRTKALEERVEYINASRLTGINKDEFYITNENGKVGFKVNDNGAHSSDFTIAREDKTISLYEKIGALDEQNENIEDVISTLINDVSTNAEAINQLDERTYYLNAEESDVFYITDGDGRIGLKVDNNGTTSYNFITKKTDLNSLADQTKEIVDAIDFIQGDALVNLQEQIIKLDKKTKYMNASDEKSQAFYITDGDGYIAAIIDGTGITSFNFISHGVTDLNSLYAELVKQGIDIQSINDTLASVDEDISDLNNRTQKLELKTRYMNASQDDNILYVTDNVGRVIMKVDHEGIHSIEFDADGLYIKESIIELFNKNTSIHDILDNFNTTINALAQKTKYMNASDEEGTFYVADKEGRVGFKIDENGITYSSDFKIILDEEDEEGNKKYISLHELNDNVNVEIKDRQEIDQSLRDSIAANINAIEGLTTRITDIEDEIDNTLATKDEVSFLSQQVIKHGEDIEDLENGIDDLSDNLQSTDNRVEKLETRTQYINASQLEEGIEKDEFYIVDEEGFINFKVNEVGAYSSDFIIVLNDDIEIDKKEISLSEKIKSLDTIDNELKTEDQNIKDSIITLNNELNKSINDTKDELDKSIAANTKLINDTEDKLNKLINDTEDELNQIITTKENALIDSINGLDDRVDATEQQIKTLQSNSATKENIENINGAIKNINEHLGQHDEAIDDIQEINIQQTDRLDNIDPRVEKLEKRTQYLNASGSGDISAFYLVDEEGHIGFKVASEEEYTSAVFANQYYLWSKNKEQIPVIGYEKTGTIEIE